MAERGEEKRALKLANNGNAEAPLVSPVKFICHHPSDSFCLLIRGEEAEEGEEEEGQAYIHR